MTTNADRSQLPEGHEAVPPLSPVQVVHENPYFRVRDRAGYFSVDYVEPVVSILPLLGDRIVLVRVYRPMLDATPWELPAGGALPGEAPAVAAQRELREETGIDIRDLSRFVARPSYAISPRHVVLPHVFGVQLTPDDWESRAPHDQEIHTVACFRKAEVAKMIVSGQIWLSESITPLARELLADFGDDLNG